MDYYEYVAASRARVSCLTSLKLVSGRGIIESRCSRYLSNNLALLLVEHGVGLKKLVSYTLGDTKANTGVIDLTQREGHLGVCLLDFVESLFDKYRHISTPTRK
jgi:hypothetical protein